MRIHINVDTRHGPCGNGSVAVELLDEHGRPFPGIGMRSIPVSNEFSLAKRVQWQAGPPADPRSYTTGYANITSGAPIRARFTISGTARLFAFRFLRVGDKEGRHD